MASVMFWMHPASAGGPIHPAMPHIAYWPGARRRSLNTRRSILPATLARPKCALTLADEYPLIEFNFKIAWLNALCSSILLMADLLHI